MQLLYYMQPAKMAHTVQYTGMMCTVQFHCPTYAQIRPEDNQLGSRIL